MAYLNNIPQATDRIKDSQPQILANFAEIQTLVGVNHVNFNAVDQGKHTFSFGLLLLFCATGCRQQN